MRLVLNGIKIERNKDIFVHQSRQGYLLIIFRAVMNKSKTNSKYTNINKSINKIS